MNVNEYLKATRAKVWEVRPPIVCGDGLKMSVQASNTHYCVPCENDGPYTAIEIGFPSQPIPEIMEWAENPETPTDTWYGYVPVGVVDAIIVAHGGIANIPA